MERSLVRLQDLAQRPILGFRAPEFSVGPPGHWCFEILAELGFRYDSSVFPLPHSRYGIPEASRHPFAIVTPSGTIYEYPLATWDIGRFRLPVAGGSYFRLLPSRLLHRALNDIDASNRTAVLYFHPYEFHPGWLNLPRSVWRRSLRANDLKFTLSRILLHNFRTSYIVQCLKPLLARFEFMPLGDIYRATTPERSMDGHE